MMNKHSKTCENSTINERNTFVSTVAENIKEFRTAKGLSQKSLANAIGVSQKAIDFWERGVNEPKATYIVRLSDFFDVPADILLGRKTF